MDSGTDLLQHIMSVLEHAEADLAKARKKALKKPGLSDADRQRLEAYAQGARDTIEVFRKGIMEIMVPSPSRAYTGRRA
jgi:hypothetical protein